MVDVGKVVADTAVAVVERVVAAVDEGALVVAVDEGALVVAVDEGVLAAVVARVVDGAMVDGAMVAAAGGFQPRMVVPAHVSESTLLSRPHSLWSIDIPQRAFTEIQLALYVHQKPRNCGIQLEGSLSPFDRLLDDDTAINVRESEVSFA